MNLLLVDTVAYGECCTHVIADDHEAVDVFGCHGFLVDWFPDSSLSVRYDN